MKKNILSLILIICAIISFIMFFISRNNQEYLVVFDSNGGTIIQNQKVKYHKNVIKPQDPVRNNFVFQGWMKDGQKYNFETKVEENILLTASWQEKNAFVVTITLDGEEHKSNVYDGNIINIESFALPQKDGYHIVLYNNDQVFSLNTPITANINLIAKYEKNS